LVPAARASVSDVSFTLFVRFFLYFDLLHHHLPSFPTRRSSDLSLSHLARRHNTTVRALREANHLQSDFLKVGQKLRLADNGRTPANSAHAERYAQLERLQQRLLPTKRFQHQVRPGERLWIIAQR